MCRLIPAATRPACHRGFQVFNTSYPQVQRRVDLRALQLSPFTAGMLLHTGAGRVAVRGPHPAPGPPASSWPTANRAGAVLPRRAGLPHPRPPGKGQPYHRVDLSRG